MGRTEALLALLIALVATSCATAGHHEGAFRVLVYNIHAGKDPVGGRNLDRVAALVRGLQPDLVLLQEVDRGTERSGHVDQLAELEQRTGLHGAFGKTLDYQGGEYGIAVLSRWPITVDTLVRLPVEPPQQRAGGSYEPRGALHVVIAAPGGALHVIDTHLDSSTEDVYRIQEVRTLRAIAETAHAGSPLVVVGGDLNAEPGSRVVGYLADSFLRDAWPGCGQGPGFSYPAEEPVKRIDYLFIPDTFECLRAEAATSETSDHLPVLFVVRLR
jgi:endonuclease/exonuclease/phosphatase family metal-dependent hydrolase